MRYETLIYGHEDGIGTVTLNRPERRNALNTVLVREFSTLLDDMAKGDDPRVVILTGGPKSFCAGVDLKEQSPTVMDELRELLRKLHDFPRPVVAAINGACLAGGLEMAMSCDLRVAAEDSVLGLPEIRFGSLAAAGGTQKLPRLIGVARAKEMHYTGEPITAREAYHFGLVNRVVPAASVLDEARRLAGVIAERSATVLKLAKHLIDTGMNMELDRALELEARTGRSLLSNAEQLKTEMGKAAQREDTYKKLFG